MNTKEPKFTTIDHYIQSFPKNIQEILEKIRAIYKQAVPNATQEISYGIPTFKINGKYFLYFAAFKNHISIYPATDELVKAIPEAEKYRVSRGTLKFPLNKPIPYDLIEQIVNYKANLVN